MNIFRLDNDPIVCAQYHCDKHVVMTDNKFYIIVVGIVSIIITAMLDYGNNVLLPYWISLLLIIITLAGIFTDD